MFKKELLSLLLGTILGIIPGITLKANILPPNHCQQVNGTIAVINNCWIVIPLDISLQSTTYSAPCCGVDTAPQWIPHNGGRAVFSIVNNCPYNITGAGQIPNFTLNNGQTLTITGSFPHPCTISGP